MRVRQRKDVLLSRAMHGPNKWQCRNLSWHLVQMSICNWSIVSHGAKNNMGSEGKGKKNIRKLFSCDLPGMKKSVGQGQSKAGNLLASMCLGNNHLQKLCHSVAWESSLWRVPLPISSAGLLNVLKLGGWEHPYWHQKQHWQVLRRTDVCQTMGETSPKLVTTVGKQLNGEFRLLNSVT